MRLPLFYLSAFTSQPYAGNPAAVCLLNSWLDDEALGKVATENQLSATAFLVDRGETWELRWFTRHRELRLCGHATLAAGYVVLTLLRPGAKKVRFASRFHGVVEVAKEDGLLSLDFPAFEAEACREALSELVAGLGLTEKPAEILQGNQTYVVVFDSAEKIRQLQPRFDVLRHLHPHAVVVTAPAEAADFVSRYFAPSYGMNEDPATGSSHSLLTPYWTKRLGKTQLHARQLSTRGGELWCEVNGDRVTLYGNVVLTLQGSIEF